MNNTGVRDMIFKNRLHLITGKGGVGKSVISIALSLLLRKTGKRVLFVQMSPVEESRAEQKDVFVKIKNKLPEMDYIYIEPGSALEEYGLMILKFKRLYKMVFEDRWVKSSIRAMPSLSFLLLIGKLWYYCTLKKKSSNFLYDYVVVDAPSTGMAISMFNLPHIINDAAPSGPLRDRAIDIENMLKNKKMTSVHIVTTCEETPVNEAIELYNTISKKLSMQFGIFFVNSYNSPDRGDEEYILASKDKIPELLFNCIMKRIEENRFKDIEYQRLVTNIPDIDRRFITIPPFYDIFQTDRLIREIMICMERGIERQSI